MSGSHTTNFSDLNGTAETGKGDKSQQPSGCYVSTAKGFILTFLALTIAVLIGVIVYFASPGRTVECKCVLPETPPPISDAQKWQECLDLSREKNICLSGPDCPGMGGTTPPPPDTSSMAPTLTPNVRLPLKVTPVHYDLELTPDIYTGNPETFSFSGHVRIHVRCLQATDVITLHINKLEIEGAVEMLDAGPSAGVPMVESVSRDEDRQFLLVKLDNTLTVGMVYVMAMSFRGPLKDDLVGLYWSSYKAGAETRYLATTQLQPTDARKTFPCFDEPGVKATFNTTLVRKANMKSLSNMNTLRTDTRPGGWEADVYAETVKMSTYLLAFIICDFEYTEGVTSSGTKFRVWSRPEAIDQTQYALEKGIATIEYFEGYFDIPFPLPKQDMIAVPDFAAGAMENWGLIIYRETALLYDTQLSSAGNLQRVAEVVVHELAHQWFGNLVTPVWWDDLWLNEGFASYMEYVGMDHIEPTWAMHDQVVERDVQLVFLIDSLSTSHPIWVPVNHPDEINEIFDRISYLKGASIIRMMNFFLGEDTFTAGLTNYLNAYEYSNSNHTDLWKYLGDQADQDNKDIDVSAVMNTWVRQMGYPLITITIDGTSASVTQEHFLTDPSKPPVDDKYPSPYGYKWNVPLTFRQNTEALETWDNPTLLWMMTGDTSNTLSNLDTGADWLIGNVGQYGYYRVSYNIENWNALINQLVTDNSVIPVKNRAQIIDDSVNLGRSGYLDQLVGLRVTEYLVSETEYIPWKAASDVLAYINRMLQYTEYYGAFKAYMLKQVMPLYTSVGYEYDQVTEPHLDRYKRSLAWDIACEYGDETCLGNATMALREWMQNPSDDSIIKPDMKTVIYCNGIRNGGVEEWNFLYQKYKDTNVAAEADRILSALACSEEPWILNRFMNYALDPNEVRRQDAIYVISDVSYNTVGRNLAWDFFRAKWPVIDEIWGSGFFAISNVIRGVTQSFNTEFLLGQMMQFRAEYPNMGSGNRAFDQATESVQNNIKWMKMNKDKLGDWLVAKTA